MSDEKHKAKLERVNMGYYFSECSCGWSGGVYGSRGMAKLAHAVHAHRATQEHASEAVEDA